MGYGMRALLPHVPCYVVEGSGHVIQIDQPQACNRLLPELFGAASTAPPNGLPATARTGSSA